MMPRPVCLPGECTRPNPIETPSWTQLLSVDEATKILGTSARVPRRLIAERCTNRWYAVHATRVASLTITPHLRAWEAPDLGIARSHTRPARHSARRRRMVTRFARRPRHRRPWRWNRPQRPTTLSAIARLPRGTGRRI